MLKPNDEDAQILFRDIWYNDSPSNNKQEIKPIKKRFNHLLIVMRKFLENYKKCNFKILLSRNCPIQNHLNVN